MDRATAIVVGVAAVQVVLLVILVAKNGAWGYFSDEFYHIACSERLAWGYVDHPPLTVALLALIRTVFGDAVWAMRLGPILATAGIIVLTGLMARRLGAGTFGQGLAALAAAVAPWYLIPASTWTLNSFDTLFWALGAYVILGILKNGDSKGWLLVGLIAGLGLLTKLSMGYFLIGLLRGPGPHAEPQVLCEQGRRQAPPRVAPVGRGRAGFSDLPPACHLASPKRLADDRVRARFQRCFWHRAAGVSTWPGRWNEPLQPPDLAYGSLLLLG